MTHDVPWACVLDPANRVSLAVVRSLGRAGVPVRLGIPDLSRWKIPPEGPASRSRYVRGLLALPCPLEQDAFCEALERGTAAGEVLLPVSTDSLLAALSAPRLREVRKLPFASLEKVRLANSKPRMLERARGLGLAVPATLAAGSVEEAAAAARGLPYPQVLKLTDDEGLFLPPSSRYAIVQSAAGFAAAYGRLHAIKPLPVAQEYIDGEGVGVSLLYWKGRRVAGFCHRRLREYPRSGGPASLAESVCDPDLLSAASRLLESLEWEGPAMVEFRRERGTGRAFLMEVNPRFWGTLPLAIACGIDFPFLCYRLALGEEVSSVGSYPVGVRLRFGAMDWAGVAQRLGRFQFGRALQEAGDILSDRDCLDGLKDPDDPAPSGGQWSRAVRRLLRLHSELGTRNSEL